MMMIVMMMMMMVIMMMIALYPNDRTENLFLGVGFIFIFISIDYYQHSKKLVGLYYFQSPHLIICLGVHPLPHSCIRVNIFLITMMIDTR